MLRLPLSLLVRPLIAIAALAVVHARAEPPCNRAVPVEEKCEIALSELHPTQSAVGMIQVEERAARMQGETDFIKYTRQRPVPVVEAPDGAFYLTDSHHLVSVLSRIGATRVTARIIGRFDNPDTFWQEMETRRWVYLFDPKGNPIPPSALPRRITDMADDPYRALAGYAEDAGYFHKTDAYFMEFHWARYFGSRMDWRPVHRMNLLEALQAAERLACEPQAKDLPGYAGPCRP
ncbi:MAG TPA: ParB-like protein [Noviherbaspirillum sp.]|uniref:ParB-like protein n=1 Tax=Noviherbaspirillum sp. TaxID=1926288 RepID=UPI002D5EDDC9|nr:ParB-like protein [Noviherbaspirillum sp.]HYD97357.1 ParB-like protein [Noviherbaspirillum sp.]